MKVVIQKAEPPKILEKDVQREIIKYLRANNWFVVINVTYSQSCFATKGISDLVAVKTHTFPASPVHHILVDVPRTIWLEVKAPGKKQSPNQVIFQEKIEEQGGEYLCADSLDKVIEYLER